MAFIISIKDEDGFEVRLRPGGAAERSISYQVIKKLEDHGVGWFKSEANVLAAVEKAIKETVYELKSDILPSR